MQKKDIKDFRPYFKTFFAFPKRQNLMNNHNLEKIFQKTPTHTRHQTHDENQKRCEVAYKLQNRHPINESFF